MRYGHPVFWPLLTALSLCQVRPTAAFLSDDAKKCEEPEGLTPAQRIEHCDRALKLPNFPWLDRAGLHFFRGTARIELGASQADAAIADFTEALRLKPDLAEA